MPGGGGGEVGPGAGKCTQAWPSLTANSWHGALHIKGDTRPAPRKAREWTSRATVRVRACVGEGSE